MRMESDSITHKGKETKEGTVIVLQSLCVNLSMVKFIF